MMGPRCWGEAGGDVLWAVYVRLEDSGLGHGLKEVPPDES